MHAVGCTGERGDGCTGRGGEGCTGRGRRDVRGGCTGDVRGVGGRWGERRGVYGGRDLRGDHRQETPSLVAGHSQPQGCVVSLVAVAAHCAAARANFYLRVVRPDLVVQFARNYDASLWQCMCRILGVPAVTRWPKPLLLYPLLLVECDCEAQRGRGSNTFSMFQERNCGKADRRISGRRSRVPMFGAVHAAAQELDRVGFVVPEWTALAGGLRPGPREPEHHEPGAPRARMATRGCQLRGTPLSRNVHFASPQPHATGPESFSNVAFPLLCF